MRLFAGPRASSALLYVEDRLTQAIVLLEVPMPIMRRTQVVPARTIMLEMAVRAITVSAAITPLFAELPLVETTISKLPVVEVSVAIILGAEVAPIIAAVVVAAAAAVEILFVSIFATHTTIVARLPIVSCPIKSLLTRRTPETVLLIARIARLAIA